MSLAAIIAAVDARFASGNSVPVERAPIKAEEWAGIRAALSTPPAGEWMPIASAPKDGEWILVGAPGEEVMWAAWGIGSPWIDGWYSTGHRSDSEGPGYSPTHWQPLPQPPEPATQEVG